MHLVVALSFGNFKKIIDSPHKDRNWFEKFIQITIALSLDNNKLDNKMLTMKIFLMIHDFL